MKSIKKIKSRKTLKIKKIIKRKKINIKKKINQFKSYFNKIQKIILINNNYYDNL